MDKSLPNSPGKAPKNHRKQPVVAGDEWDAQREYHDSLFHTESTDRAGNAYAEESRNTPLFSVDVARNLKAQLRENPFPQYGILAKKDKIHDHGDGEEDPVREMNEDTLKEPEDDRIFLNMNAPFSVFLCGSQGSGKSHTLSCMLEIALRRSELGELPQPMAGLVFHYDKFSGSSHHQPCEAAYLCSSGIPVNVLVPLSSRHRMERSYTSLPGLPADGPRPTVHSLLLREEHLDVSTMMKLMKVDSEKGNILYMEVGFTPERTVLLI
ncbi:MAG: hypothetical protein Q9219_001301 [cf. Caloplaca sp. 3 TL-2023]